jgi:hypothetical protein
LSYKRRKILSIQEVKEKGKEKRKVKEKGKEKRKVKEYQH